MFHKSHIQFYSMSVPHSYNPSDYEYLLRSITEGSPAAKAEALKRFQILASSDKKQFGVYAKRIILALQELINQPKVPLSNSGRDQYSRYDVDLVDHQPQSQRYRVLHSNQNSQKSSRKPWRSFSPTQKNFTLLHPRLHQDI